VHLQGKFQEHHVSPVRVHGLTSMSDCKKVLLHFDGDDPKDNRSIVTRPGPRADDEIE
jgi:hypothetical protein